MSKGDYLGGRSIVDSAGKFSTYDPAEDERRHILDPKRRGRPIVVSDAHAKQTAVQLEILLRKVAILATGRRKKAGLPHVPVIFREEVGQFKDIINWAESKPEYDEIYKKVRRDQTK